jgi:glycosyltransferase involved in cell wall biosynthesis
VTVIKNAVRSIDLESRESARAFLEEKCAGLSAYDLENTIWIGTIAELNPIKGLKYAIQAIGELRKNGTPVRYVIISGGSERDALEDLIEQHGLRSSVFLAGFVIDAARYLQAFDIFLLPSLSEGLGYVLLEAGSVPLPIIATNVGGIPEIITNEKEGVLIPPRDQGAISRVLQTLINDPALRTRYAEEIGKRVQNDFSFEKMWTATEAVYRGMN